MSKLLNLLQNNNLVDERLIYMGGSKVKSLLVGSAKTAANSCILSVSKDELIISKRTLHEVRTFERYSKENIKQANMKHGIIFNKLILTPYDGKKIYFVIGLHKKMIKEIVDLFN